MALKMAGKKATSTSTVAPADRVKQSFPKLKNASELLDQAWAAGEAPKMHDGGTAIMKLPQFLPTPPSEGRELGCRSRECDHHQDEGKPDLHRAPGNGSSR